MSKPALCSGAWVILTLQRTVISARGAISIRTQCWHSIRYREAALVLPFTPHDLHDYDATEPLALVDAEFQGRERKLVLQANRNGFLYVLDRTNGQLLLAKPFVKKLNGQVGLVRTENRSCCPRISLPKLG